MERFPSAYASRTTRRRRAREPWRVGQFGTVAMALLPLALLLWAIPPSF